MPSSPRYAPAPDTPDYAGEMHQQHATRRPSASLRTLNSWFEAWIEDWWLWELLALALSVSLTVALCIVLAHYQGQPVPNFDHLLNSDITINTVVSLLATIAVAAGLVAVQECLSQLKWRWYTHSHGRPLADLDIYDRASRGTLGSAGLLWSTRGRPLPSIGALLIILHLAVVPLAQQSVLTVLQDVPDPNGSATALISNAWRVTAASENTELPGGYNAINSTVKGAVLGGLFTANESVQEVPPVCSSAHCTFPSFQSLAVCSAVADVSHHLTNSSNPDGSISWCLGKDQCLVVSGNAPPLANLTSAAAPSIAVSWASGPLLPANYTSLAFGDRVSPIADAYIIYRNVTYPGFKENGTNAELRYSAVEFVLDWCVPTFDTQVESGTATTTRRPEPFYSFDAPVLGQSMRAEVNGTRYAVDTNTHASMQRYLWVLLSGSVSTGPQFEITFTNSDAAIALWAAFQTEQSDEWFFGRSQVPSQDAGIQKLESILNNTATSMSNLVRRSGTLAPVQGVPLVPQSTVYVEWGYVGALIAFTIAATLFSLAVIIGGAYRPAAHPPVWKSSTFPVLQSLAPSVQQSLGSPHSTSYAKQNAAMLPVRLVREGRGWRLVASADSKVEATPDKLIPSA